MQNTGELMKPIINYKEQMKVRICNPDKSRAKHETIKLIIMMLSKLKYPDAGIYSEYELSNGQFVDVVIDLGKEKIYYEVQKEITKDWLDMIKQRDLDLDTNTQVIPLKELPNDIDGLLIALEEALI